MDYNSLGKRESTRKRRGSVYELTLVGFRPSDIATRLKQPLRNIYRDLEVIRNLPIERNPDLEEGKMKARDYWYGRLRHYTLMEIKENHPNLKVAWSKLKDAAFEKYQAIIFSNLEERIAKLEEAIIYAK